MKPSIRTYLCNDKNQRFFGEGPLQLLHAIEETGSLRSAALSMNMAYTKALRIIRADRPHHRRKRRRRQPDNGGGEGVSDYV